MIENIRKHEKLSKLLNTFHVSWISACILMFIKNMDIIKQNEFITKIVSPLPLFCTVIGFSTIGMCMIAYLGNLKEVYNAIWFNKITSIILGIMTTIILTQSLVTKNPINTIGLIYVLLGVLCSKYVIENVDAK